MRINDQCWWIMGNMIMNDILWWWMIMNANEWWWIIKNDKYWWMMNIYGWWMMTKWWWLPIEADERTADHRAIVEDRRASSRTPRHHRRPTNEQRNTTPTSKDDKRVADHRTIVDSRETTPDSNPSSVSNRESQLQFLTSRQCSIETATISHASQSTSTTIERI